MVRYVDRTSVNPVSHNPTLLKAEKAELCERFEMTDLGLIKRNRESLTLTISQTNSTWTKVLKKFGMKNCKPVSTSRKPGRKFQHFAPSAVRSLSIFRPTNWQLDF